MPASAPTPGGPGTTSDNKAISAAQRVLRITLQGETLALTPDSIPFKVRAKIRKGTGGLPFEAYWNGETSFGEDTLLVMWWAARMVNGELGLTIDQVEAEWPRPLQPGDWDVELDDPNANDEDAALEVDNPESSGPSS